MAGFGFVKQAAQQAGKKMYGYGQRGAQVLKDNPGAGIAAAGVGGTIGLTQAGVIQPDWDGSKQLGDEYIVNYMKNEHGKWLESEFNAEKDIPHIMEVMRNAYDSLRFRMHGSPEQEINDTTRKPSGSRNETTPPAEHLETLSSK